MFCAKCGQPVDEGSQFCEKCGAPVEQAAPTTGQAPAYGSEAAYTAAGYEAAPTYQPVYQQPAAPGGGKKSGGFMKKAGIFIIAGVAVLALVIGLLVFFLTRPASISINEYVSFQYAGYNTVGTAAHRFDVEQFCDDNHDKVDIPRKYRDRFAFILERSGLDEETVNRMLCKELANSYIAAHLNKSDNLSNGDSLEFTWQCKDEQVLDYFGIKLIHEDMKPTVEGLKEPEKLDPFEKLELVYTGKAPFATASINWDLLPREVQSLDLELDVSRNLKNGDVITVTVENAESDRFKEGFLRNYGAVLSQTTKTYTVENIPSYITELDQISKESMEKMQAQAQDVIKAYEAKRWSEFCEITGMNLEGSYFLSRKEGKYRENGFNQIMLVYKIDSTVKIPEEEVDETVTFYTGVYYNNLVLYPDGTIELNMSDSGMVSHEFSQNFPGYNSFRYRGYEDLDSMYKDCVTSYIDDYTCSSTVGK